MYLQKDCSVSSLDFLLNGMFGSLFVVENLQIQNLTDVS